MEKQDFKGYVVEFFKRAYEQFNTGYRMSKFEKMVESGEIKNMCSSEVHKRFRVLG